MNSTILMSVCLAGAAALSLAWAVAALNERGVNPLAELCRRDRRLPRFAQFLLPALVVQLIVYGSTKQPTNDAPGDVSSPTNAPPFVQ